MLDILKNLYYYKYLSLEKLNASFQNVQKKDQKSKKKKKFGFMGHNIYQLSFPQKWKPDDPEKPASKAPGELKSLFCNGWKIFFFIYSVHINTSEHTLLGGGDRGCRESV